ncbi:unnamed protein product [Polarella glacialis]|uniref:tRNA (guanine(9)-N(1))-methyltransferase n=1 Tax=Polarella glacialis TaxID=89957 RepID=A0A813FPQ0_POLGL|nr:unnamed protein product [Polarella glacialis]CAE8688162.1 unnamed protein product [Polarella glacialis]
MASSSADQALEVEASAVDSAHGPESFEDRPEGMDEDGEGSGQEDKDCENDREGGDQESRKDRKRRMKEERRGEWKAAQKANKKAKQSSARSNRRKLPPLPTDLPGADGDGGQVRFKHESKGIESPEEVKSRRLARKTFEVEDFDNRSSKGTTVIIDLEWEETMQQKELKSLVQQVLYCYGANRRATHPVRMVLSGVQENGEIGAGLRKQSGFEAWPLQVLPGPYIEAFPREKLVYLTADSEVVLESFDPEKVYIIGGIVDRNRLKGATMDKAVEQEIATAQLPLAAHIEMGVSSRVLAVNHVFAMVLDHQASGDWRGVCDRCVPGRKVMVEQGKETDEVAKEGPPEDQNQEEAGQEDQGDAGQKGPQKIAEE